jgi:Holliday junction DNA helicase RuvB
MESERVITGKATEEEIRLFAQLRPRRLAEIIGQRSIVENLTISVEAALERGEPLDHVLFHGPPGLGKTTLAHVIAVEMGRKIVATSGPALERPGDLMGILTNLEKGDVLFIDEIHRLPTVVEEFLYPAMEDFKIDFVLDKGPYARTVKFRLKPFTMVGATTRAGMLTGPLRNRFGIFHHVDFYAEEDLAQIVARSAGILGVAADEEGAREIARRSRGTPRVANRLLKRVRDYAQVKAGGAISRAVVDEALEMLGIDERGLDRLDREFLSAIIDQYSGGPVGIRAICATLHEDADTLVDMVEPFLLKIAFIARTPRGRVATEPAYAHLGRRQLQQGQERLPV